MKILVISLAGIGDTLLVTPMLHELRINFPGATIHILVKEAGARDLLENNPHIDKVIFKNLLRCGKFAALNFFRSLRAEGYDVSINTHPQTRRLYRYAARIIGARRRLSHEYECFGWMDRRLVTETMPQNYETPTIIQNLAFVALLRGNLQTGDMKTKVFLKPEEEKWAEDFLAQHNLQNKKKLGIHVGSGSTKNLRLKRWPLASYIELIQRLNKERPDIHVLLFGGPDEVKEHQKILAGTNPKLVSQAETKNLRQAAALMKRLDAFLSVDTALMHLAATMQVPHQMVIEAPTLNKTNLPFGNNYVLVSNPAIKGRHLEFYRFDGKDIHGTEKQLLDLMAAVTVTKVYQAIDRGLSVVIRPAT